jgi:predicted GIY-YIG superfamily endonuclease
MPTDRATALYRLFRSDGLLLYVGISFNPLTRLRQHRRTKAWWSDVCATKTVVEWHRSRAAAEAAEMAAIRREKPLHNIVTSDQSGCARFLPRQTGAQWGRPRWVAQPAVAERIDEVVLLKTLWIQAESEFRAELLRLVNTQGSSVPVTYIAGRLGVHRKTIYRHLEAGRAEIGVSVLPALDSEVAESVKQINLRPASHISSILIPNGA